MIWQPVTPVGPVCGWHWLSPPHAPGGCVAVQVPGATQSQSPVPGPVQHAFGVPMPVHSGEMRSHARVRLLLQTDPAQGPMKVAGLLWIAGTTLSLTAQSGGLPGQIVAHVDAMPAI